MPLIARWTWRLLNFHSSITVDLRGETRNRTRHVRGCDSEARARSRADRVRKCDGKRRDTLHREIAISEDRCVVFKHLDSFGPSFRLLMRQHGDANLGPGSTLRNSRFGD